MLRKLLVPVLALAAVPTIASAQFEAGDYELSLAGTGTATRQTNGGSFGAQITGGYFLTKEIEIGVKQNVSWFDNNQNTPGVDENGWGGRTGAFVAYHFDLGAFQPYVAAQGGYDYPEFAGGEPYVAPEAGLKYFVNGTTFLFGNVAYIYETSRPGQDSFFEGNLGVGFRF